MKNNEIGARIRALRKLHKISQKDIYEATGISSGNLNSMETGKTLPSSASLMSLSKLFHCTTDYILFGQETETIQPTPKQESNNPNCYVQLNDKENLLIERYRKMDAKGKKEMQLYAYIKALTELPSDI